MFRFLFFVPLLLFSGSCYCFLFQFQFCFFFGSIHLVFTVSFFVCVVAALLRFFRFGWSPPRRWAMEFSVRGLGGFKWVRQICLPCGSGGGSAGHAVFRRFWCCSGEI
jgi:hypothetical protein